MRLLILSWEYPPYVVGGLGRHVAELAPALAQQNVEVHVITPTATIQHVAVVEEQLVHVHRVFAPGLTAKTDIYNQVIQVNRTLENYVMHQLVEEKFDLVHVHDWLTAFAGIKLQRAKGWPLIATIHATERGRGRGYIGNDLQRRIDETERMLIQDADHVIVCSRFMAEEVRSFFHTPPSRIDVVPNGVNIADMQVNCTPAERLAFRAKYAEPADLIIFSVTRLVYEKGIHRLVEAAPQILAEFPQARIIIAGKGPEAETLKHQVDYLGVSRRVNFVGFISDEERNLFYKVANCAIFPSIYEPFGIVALEAMATGCPVIVSDVGGLSEIIDHTRTGITIYPDDAGSVTWGVLRILNDAEAAQQNAVNAFRYVEQLYNWPRIARLTRAVYNRVFNAAQVRMKQKSFDSTSQL
ncbi:MAG: glycosyltransferase family 4 protein [Anaerolineae bacterium]|nr:glycosyltransferase family 4 protein [Anaerolineae bacterium]